MSHQYAGLLSEYDNKGVVGQSEIFDSETEIASKARQLAEWIRAAKCCMVFTGAGVSTAAGIPDFRGPNGIWTLEKKAADETAAKSKGKRAPKPNRLAHGSQLLNAAKPQSDSQPPTKKKPKTLDLTESAEPKSEPSPTSSQTTPVDMRNGTAPVDFTMQYNEQSAANLTKQSAKVGEPMDAETLKSKISEMQTDPADGTDEKPLAETATSLKSETKMETDEIEPPKSLNNFEEAQPTFTHNALRVLEAHGYIKFLLTQNVDGLHSRFGFPMDRLAEVHGNVFVERCDRCERQYFRPHPLQSCGRKPTGAACEGNAGRSCRGKLCDFLLDWEDELPEPELSRVQRFAAAADLSLCLGTTLQIQPVGRMPLSAKRNEGGRVATENKVDLAIHGKVDAVLRVVMEELGLLGEVEELSRSNQQPDVRWKSDQPEYLVTKKSKKRKGSS